LFSIDGLSFYIPAEVEPLMYDRVFDWEDNTGLVMPPCAASNGGITLLLQSTRLVAAVAILGR
jgi:hypothetical protein